VFFIIIFKLMVEREGGISERIGNKFLKEFKICGMKRGNIFLRFDSIHKENEGSNAKSNNRKQDEEEKLDVFFTFFHFSIAVN